MNLTVHLQELEREQRRAAEAVRAACLHGALDAYERAGLGGLCEAGRWEMVVDALQSLDVDAIVRGLAPGPDGETRQDGAGHR